MHGSNSEVRILLYSIINTEENSYFISHFIYECVVEQPVLLTACCLPCLVIAQPTSAAYGHYSYENPKPTT
jgi:hypothetical protein